MQDHKYVFAGNRFYVLEQMLARNLDLEAILAVPGSYLERVLQARGIGFTRMESKEQLIALLEATRFDWFVANGCPFILPISRLATGGRRFVNVHPSPLPDLRGADPVPGALLHHRDAGATCHLMDDGVDTGATIARVVIPNTSDLGCGLLYQLSFVAEVEVFHAAFERGFEPLPRTAGSAEGAETIYYTRKDADLEIDFAESSAKIIDRVRAFNTRSQGARFHVDGETFRVLDAAVVDNPFLMERRDRYQPNQVVFRYENAVLVRHGAAFLELKAVEGDLTRLEPGRILAGRGTPQ